MSSLRVTLIDVGWGDSILLEAEDRRGVTHYALIDSNDTVHLRSSYIFLKRHFEKRRLTPAQRPRFEFVLLTHEHADHAQGLKATMREFGTRQFWYPKSAALTSFAHLLRFAQRSNAVEHHEAVDSGKRLPKFGDATMEVLWPPPDTIDSNPNENSVVLLLRLGEVAVVLTGDAEEKVWAAIADRIPRETRFFKVPHHGSENGTFDANGGTPWLDRCPEEAVLGISSHIQPHLLPDETVLERFTQRNFEYLRTDREYHITFETDGHDVSFYYTQV